MSGAVGSDPRPCRVARIALVAYTQSTAEWMWWVGRLGTH